MASSNNFFSMAMFMALLGMVTSRGVHFGSKINGQWNDAHATFYGDMSGGETMRKCVIYIKHVYGSFSTFS